MRHGMSGDDALALFDRKGVTSYLTGHYDVLHTQGKDWLVDDIDQSATFGQALKLSRS